MIATRHNADSRWRRMRPRGFTLVELTVAITVMGVLVGMSAVHFGRSLEQSRADFAAANLRSIWAAQRLYWLENRVYADSLNQDSPKGLYQLGLIDSSIISVTGDYTYTITSSSNTAFTVEAVRASNSSNTGWAGTLSIDQTGTVSGQISAAGGETITPGFQ